MDIHTTRQKRLNIKRYIIVLPVAIAVLSAVYYLRMLGQAGYRVDAETLAFDEVRRGDFTVSVRGTGVLVPVNIQWLSADVDATVTRLAVKPGNIVREGDLLVQLNNPQLVQQLAESQWELEALQAEAKADKVAQELALLEQEAGVADSKMNYESSLLREKAQARLLETNAVSRLDYERTALETAQFKQRWEIGRRQLGKMRENVTAQDRARTARLHKARKRFERIGQQVDELNVRATMDSIVLAMPLEAGQRLVMGDNIAKLAQQDALIAELQVPEILIRSVTAGQRVIVDTRNNTIDGRVSRVDPAVVNGSVQVDVAFSRALPDDARPDLSVDGEIKVAEIDDTLYVERPVFSQSRSRSSFYRLSDDGRFAERTEVEVGYGSVNRVQIVDGLKAGDRIITSDSSRFDKYRKIRIN